MCCCDSVIFYICRLFRAPMNKYAKTRIRITWHNNHRCFLGRRKKEMMDNWVHMMRQTHEPVGRVIERPKINMWWKRRLPFLFRIRKQAVKKLDVLNGGHRKKLAELRMRCQLIKNIQPNENWILAWQCTLFIAVDNFTWRFEIHCPVPTLYCYYIVVSTIHSPPQTRRSKISSERTQTEIAGNHMR